MTGTLTGGDPAATGTPERSIVALKLAVVTAGRFVPMARYRIEVTSSRLPMMKALLGWFSTWMGMWPGNVSALADTIRPA
jgi:hypothetical protein